MWTELLAVTAPTRRELAIAFVALLLVGAALFGPQVAHGGFYWDDWQNSANVHIAGDPGLFASLDRATTRPVWGYRPVLTTMLVVEHWALGLDKHLHLAMAALFGVLTAWALYLLLRMAGLRRVDSAVPALLLLAFPWADSTRMWATASFDTLAVALYLAGAALAVRALRFPPGRVSTVASLALYLLASWTYEVVTIGILGSVALYLAVAPRRAALRRFAMDVGIVAIALILVVTGTSRTPQPLSAQIDHAGTLASQAFSLLARALVPVGPVPGWIGAVLLAVVCAYGWRRGERRWVTIAALGALYVACGYTLFVPAEPYYQPLLPGTVTRMNVLAAAGYSVLVYALVRIVVGRRIWLAPVLCTLILAGYVVKVAHDEQGWRRSARIQAQVLDALPARAIPGTTYYTFGARSYAAPGIPAFSLSFDLKAAARLRYKTALIAAYPIRGTDVIRCDADLLYPTGGTYGRIHGARYGHAVFVVVPTHTAIAIRNPAECLRWRAKLGAAR